MASWPWWNSGGKPSREVLAQIRGALWTVQGNFPWAHRPGQDSNIFAPDYFESYAPADSARGVALYHQRRYNTAPTGPFVDAGYHGEFPGCDFTGNLDAYLTAVLDPLWNAGIAPALFLKPDGWTLAQLQVYESTFRNPRWQDAVRIVVPGGWEPWMLNAEWVALLTWAADVFPQALRLIHMPADHDAPGLSSEPIGGDVMWANVAPYVHGWLVQNDAFAAGPTGPDFDNFTAQFNPAVRGSLVDRFRTGYAGWPTFSAWGAGKPILVYAGEFASYWVYWDARPEAEAQAWGDAAMAQGGCAGYLDGGTV